MVNFNNTKIKEYITKPFKKLGLFQKAAITTVALSTLLIGNAVAEGQIATVYHVYINDERIGTVDDQAIIEKAVQDKIDMIEDTYKNLDLVANNLSFVEEQVFRSITNNEETYTKALSDVEIVANATALMIDDEVVTYLESQEELDNTVKKLKLNYISEEELNEIEEREQSDSGPSELKEGQSRILDVSLSKKVSSSEEKINPEKILSVDEAVKLLEKGTLKEKKYKVKEGDVLGSIAEDHNLSTSELLDLNPSIKEMDFLKISQELNVTEYKPYLTVNVKIEEYVKEKIEYDYDIEEDSSMFKGDQNIKQQGEDGEKLVNYTITKTNGNTVKREKTAEKVVKEPATHIVVKGTKVVPSRGSGQLAWPAVGGYISSQTGYRWGKMHKGIDIARPSDRTIKAADNGTIVSAGWDGGYGNKIVINHNNGLKTVYAHLNSINVNVGQTVSKGQKIGVMGTTGDSTGVHLHFEVYKNGALQNPLNYVNR